MYLIIGYLPPIYGCKSTDSFILDRIKLRVREFKYIKNNQITLRRYTIMFNNFYI